MGGRYLNLAVIEQIPAQTRHNQAASDPCPNTQGWAWTYLTACLATAVGYDEARKVINQVQREILDERS